MELLSMPPRLTGTDKAKGKKMLARVIKYSIASMIFTAVAFFTLSLSAPANAVTYGETVGDPKTESPWAVSIWVSEENDASDAIPICTGTLISSKLVLTAAHCVLENISYFVKVGAVNLQDSTELVAVSNRWKNPKYNPKSLGNDIGLLQLAEEVSVGKLPSLSTPSLEKQVKGAKLTIYGWGRDHTLKVTNLLNKSALRNQDAQAGRIWAKSFNKNTMLAAGTYLPKEKLFSGGCNGDSGGPLVARIDGTLTLVGVTSWGSAKCDSSKPTIFARVSVFGPAIKQGITYLKSSSTTINQAPPVNISLPTISGTLQPEQTITCNPGTWKNAVAISISWSSPARLSGSINPKVKVTDADAGQAFTCQVVATSTQASLRKSIELVAPSKPEIRSYPTISGIPSSGSLKPDSLAICDGQSWSGAYQTESQSWYLSTNSKSPLLSNPQLLSSEKSFKITSDFIKSNSGKFLVCAAKAENNGFTTTTTVVRQIIAPAAPILYGVFISVNSYEEGALATCDFKASTDESDQKVFEWGYGDKSTFTPITGSNNNSLKISGDLIRSAAGQFLSCRLTLTNLGGNTSSTGYSSERFPSAPTDLSYKVYNSGGWTEGAYMVCDGSQTSTSKMLSVQKSWGITDANGNGFIGAPISTSDRLFVSNDLLISIAGKTLGCLVNATNAIGSTQRIFTTQIPISVAPSLPVPGSLTISKQEALTSSITVTLTIPSLSSFSSSTMDARLRFSNTSCDNRQITSFPSTITCVGLPGQTAFAPYLTVGYVANSGIAQSRSGSTSFTTVGLTPAVEMPTCSRYKTTVIYGALPTFDSSKTTFQLYAIRNIGANQSVTAYGPYPQGGIWNVDFIDINDMANYTLRFVRSDQGVETFANCVETQTAPNDATAPQVSLTDLSQYSPVTPTSISVGQNVTATFRLTDDIGITSCGATVYNVNNVDTTTNTVCTKILGTASNGVWQVSLNLNSSNNPGAYTIKAFGTDASGKTSTRLQVGSFTIVGPSVSNLTTMPTLQTIGINYVDQIVLNGINFGSISPNSPGSYAWTVRVTNSAGTIITTVPTGSNQTYITGLTGSTTYKVYLVATDSSGATKLSNALTVTTLAPASASDSIKPVVVDGSSEMVSGWTMKIGMTPTLSLIATDNVGVENVTVTLIANNLTVGTFNASLFSGTKANGVWRVQLSFTGSTFVGNWKVSAIATDAAGNQSTQSLLREIPVSSATPVDSQNPVVVVGSGVLTTSSLETSGGTVAVTYRVTDDVGCCSYHQAWMSYPNGTVVQQVTPALISGDEKNGTFRASFNVPSGAVAGSYQIKAQALDIAGKYTDLQLLGTVTVANPSGLIPIFGARTPDYYAPGFKYQISNYDATYTWSVTSTVGTATINSSGLVSVANVAAKQSATVTVTTTKTGFNSASASITSVGPWNLSDEIQTQTITATLTGTTLTVNVPNANGWNWSLIWDGAVQRTNITSFPYTVTGFSTNKNIQLSAIDNLQNFGYSRVFLPTLVTPTPPATIQTSTGGTARYFAETGHYYEYVAGSKNFSDAKALAENATANGLKGYLLTVTSANEDTFARTFSTGANYHVWLGASDAALEGCWRWVNGSATDLSGPFFNKGNVPGCTVSGSWYTRWGANEPSDSFGTEDNASNNYADAWNDFTGAGDGSANGPTGVVIEYGDRRD
jgi:secreted trypsin-like serine protease